MSSDGRSRGPPKFPDLTPRPLWRRIKWKKTLSRTALIVAAALVGIWLVRDAAELFQSQEPREGTLVVNINSATAAELETLPGIDLALAQLIIEGRPYQTIEDLDRVQGIGPILFTSMRPLLRTQGETEELPDL